MARPSVLSRYLVVIASVALAVALRSALDATLTPTRFLAFILAVTISAWYGGWWPGVVATLISLAIADFFFSEPRYSFHVMDEGEFILSMVFVGEGLLISWLSSLRLSALERSHQMTERLRYLAWELTNAEERQRRDFAHALHDHLQQLLVAARMKLSIVHRHQHAAEPAAPALRDLDGLLRESLDYTRTMTAELSPNLLYSSGLMAALRALGEQFAQRHGLHIHFHADHEGEFLDENGRVLMFQAVRELLFNTVKHAGTDRASVTVMLMHGAVQVAIVDEGRGYDLEAVGNRPPKEGGFGLLSIRERFRAVGGVAHMESSPGHGTRVTLRLPAVTHGPRATAATLSRESGGTSPR